MKYHFALLALVLCLAALAPGQHINSHLHARSTQADARGFYWMPTAVADDYFDGTSSRERVRRHMRVAREVGARYLRCAFSWNAIEKQQGQYDWPFWDMLVRESELAGIQLIPYVGYTPEWAAADPDQFWKRPPRDPQLYADFMYTLARRYRGRIHSWEIWNEPDLPEYWMGDVDGFAELVRKASSSIRHADPQATLILAGMSKGPSEFFRALIHTHHLERVVDVIAMHGYPESWLEERQEQVFGNWIQQMNYLVAEDGTPRDFWLNEVGYADYRFSSTQASKYGVSTMFSYEHTAQYAASWLFKTQVMALASGKVSLTAWYRIDDFDPNTTTFSDDQVNFHLGLLDSKGDPKPAYYALKFFNRLFSQPTRPLLPQTLNSRAIHSDAVINLFERQDGRIVVVGWLRSLTREEAEEADGSTPDTRREAASVQVPCSRISHMTVHDASGASVASTVLFNDGWLQQITLRPDAVFVAEMECDTRKLPLSPISFLSTVPSPTAELHPTP